MKRSKKFLAVAAISLLAACGGEKVHVVTPMDAVVDSVVVDTVVVDSIKVDSIQTN